MSRSSLIVVAAAAFALGCKGNVTPPNVDADGDGFSPPLDCDDADAAVHPGAVDLFNDGVDSDCDDADGVVQNASAWSASYEPSGDDFNGFKTTSCDVDGDGLDDLFVANPLASGGGSIDLFPGPFSDGSIFSVDSIVEFSGGPGDALGYQLVCGDVDGDGNTDLVASSPSGIGGSPFRLYVWFGTSVAWQPSLSPSEAAVFELDLGEDFFSPKLFVSDLDDDGDAEIGVCLGGAPPEGTSPGLYILPGGSYSGTTPFLDAADRFGAGAGGCQNVDVLDDLNGDGFPDLAISRETSPNLLLVSNPVWSTGVGLQNIAYGDISPVAVGHSNIISGDFDGDGAKDDLVFSAGFGSNVFHIVPNAAELAAEGLNLDTTSATGAVTFGAGRTPPALAVLDDVDGDGAEDVALAAYRDDQLNMILFSPALRLSGESRISETKLFHIQQPQSDFISLISRDFDGDGLRDIAVGTSSFEGPNRLDMLFTSAL